MTEAQLHRAVAQFLRLALKPPNLWTTFPSGGGGRVRGAQLKAMGLKAGMPDIIIFAPGPYFFGIELKTAKGKQSLEQVAMAGAFRALGGGYSLCRSVDDVEAALKRRGFPLHATTMRAAA